MMISNMMDESRLAEFDHELIHDLDFDALYASNDGGMILNLTLVQDH